MINGFLRAKSGDPHTGSLKINISLENIMKYNHDNIVLVGFMGVGKGRTARSLAAKTGMHSVDCDDLIESFANKKIKAIFKDQGESYFRELERRTSKWLEQNVKSTIISTGGGFVNVPNIKKIGKIVYLHSDFDSIIKDIESHPNAAKKIRKRPLLADPVSARRLYEKRLPLYRAVADIEVHMAERTIERVTVEIAERLVSLKILRGISG